MEKPGLILRKRKFGREPQPTFVGQLHPPIAMGEGVLDQGVIQARLIPHQDGRGWLGLQILLQILCRDQLEP
jgi:hypothetical protein